MNAIAPADLAIADEAPASARTGVELLYTPSESIFAAAAPDMVANGWSVFRQEVDRRPGKIYNATIKWAADHDLKNTLPTDKTMELWCNHCATLNAACAFGPGRKNGFETDIDVLDEQASLDIAGIADEVFGYTPLRCEVRWSPDFGQDVKLIPTGCWD